MNELTKKRFVLFFTNAYDKNILLTFIIEI